MSDVRFRVRQSLEKLSTEEELIRLFGTDALGYNITLQHLSTRLFTKRSQEPISKIHILAEHGDFKIIHARLKTHGKLNLTDERPIVTQTMSKLAMPYCLFVFSDASDQLWHFVNVKYVPPEQMPAEEKRSPRQLRRITIGPDERGAGRLRTASERLSMLEIRRDQVPILDLVAKHESAFDVEEVTERFYEAYKLVFEALQTDLMAQTGDHKWSHDYALLFLNRIMFLHFVQRKRSSDGRCWIGNDPEFIASYWREYKGSGQPRDTFVEMWLKVLFFEAFNNQYQNRAEYASRFPDSIRRALARAPYLNGGLFTPNDLDENFNAKRVRVSDALFSQIFDFFESHNFTIAEDTPFDQEVAVDPEMIGKVYEGLISFTEREERRAAGIFYTPRTEIDMMCRLALVDHLAKRIGTKHKNLLSEAIFAFEPDDIRDSDAAIGEEDLWPAINNALRDITVLDPACGSGSFLVGMLNVLDGLSSRANSVLGIAESALDRRTRIIRDSLYGVDVMRWAVDVAELRLWLHLMIETDLKPEELTLHPLLPNLSFKVRCGDSLVQEIGGLDFSLLRGGRSSGRSHLGSLPTHAKGRLTALIGDKRKFYCSDPRGKYRTRHELERAESALFLNILSERHTQIQKRLAYIDSKLAETQSTMLSQEGRVKARADQAQLGTEKHSLIDEMSSIQKASVALQQRTDLPFVWSIAFLEVFESDRGGFDIVIGNPPYVRQEKIADPTIEDEDTRTNLENKRAYKTKLASSVYGAFPKYFSYDHKTGAANPSLKATNDLYVYFYFHGLSLLNSQGSFCFITSNSWLDVGYGSDLQQFLLETARSRSS